METNSLLFAIRVVVVLGHCVLVILALAILPWVKTSEAEWTLWSVCYENASISNPKNYSLNSDLCGNLGGTIPGYYTGIRAVEIILLILCILQLNACCDNKWLDKGRWPALISFVCAVLASVAIGLAFDQIKKEKDFWQGDNLEVSVSAYLNIGSLVISIGLFWFNLNYDDYRQRLRQAKEKTEPQTGSGGRSDDILSAESSESSSRGTGKVSLKRASPPKNSVVPAAAASVPSVAQRERTSLRKPRENLHHSEPSPPPPPPPPTPPPPPRDGLYLGNLPPLPASVHGGLTTQSQNHHSERLEKTYSDSTAETTSSDSELDSEFAADRYDPEISAAMSRSSSELSEMYGIDDGAGVSGENLYTEDLRSASRASYLHNQEMKKRGLGKRGELPLLENMPSYTLPPSRGSKTPVVAPPSYEEAKRGDYLDMPPPPEVSVPVGHLR